MKACKRTTSIPDQRHRLRRKFFLIPKAKISPQKFHAKMEKLVAAGLIEKHAGNQHNSYSITKAGLKERKRFGEFFHDIAS